MTQQELNQSQDLIKKLLAENAALKANAQAPKGLGIKVSTKGAVSVYGLGRWPVTLYSTQWTELLSRSEDIKAFITANASALSTKA